MPAIPPRIRLNIIALLLLLSNGWLTWRFPLRPLYREALADVRTFAPALRDGITYGSVLLAMFSLCWLAHRITQHHPPSRRFVALSTLVIGMPLLMTYPINANDVFRYVLRGRVVAIYGANPYQTPPSAFPDDPFAHLAGEWASYVSPYGPLWEGIDALVVLASGGSLLLSLIAFKLIGLLLIVACGWCIARLAPHRVLLWSWNPACFLMFVVDGHNDVLMLFWLFVALLVVQKDPLNWRRGSAAVLVGVLSPLTKLTGIVFLPFLALEIMRRLPAWRDRLRFIVTSAIGAVVLTFIVFLPFGDPRLLLSRLLTETQSGGSFSPLVYLYFLDQASPLIRISIGEWVQRASLWFVGFSIVMVVAAAFGRNYLRAVADTYFFYLLTAFNYRIWYSLWVFPWTLLDSGSEARLRFAYLFLVTSQLSVVLYGHVRIFLLDRSSSAAHLRGVPFVFLLPLIGALLWTGLVHWRENRPKASSYPT